MTAVRRLSFLALVALAACGPEEPPEPKPEAEWHVVTETLPGALFAVAGTAADDVWVVGADQGGGAGPTALHWDGAAWQRHETGLDAGDLYWVHTFDGGPTFLAGSKGRVLRYADGAFEVMTTPSEQDVWGLWGSSPDDLWAVGGNANGGETGFIWRYQAGEWTVVDLSSAPATTAWFKTWGTGASNVYFCGAGGAMAYWDGTALTPVESGTTRTLLTVHGRDDGSVVTAVGGQFSATLVESTGGDFEDVTPGEDPPLQTFGVHHRGDVARAVGMQGLALVREGDAWAVDEMHPVIRADLHGVWIDPNGNVWAAGGRIVAPPLIDGTLVYHGVTAPVAP